MMPFEWTTPTRAVGFRPLDQIPVEIYLKIFDYLDLDPQRRDNEALVTLLNLTPVCRLFFMSAFPRIFDTIHIDYQQLHVRGWSKRGSAFCRAVHAKKDGSSFFAQLPKKAVLKNFGGYGDGGRDWARMGLLKMFLTSFRYMPNLRALSLSHIEVDERGLRSICRLNLTSLALDWIYLGNGVTAASVTPEFKQLRLEHLSYHEAFLEDTLVWKRILDFSQLRSLKLDGETFCTSIVPKLIGLHDRTILQHVSIHQLHWKHLDIFYHFPGLKRVEIALPIENPTPEEIVAHKPLPGASLESLQCPLTLIRAFGKMDKLHSLEIPLLPHVDLPFDSLSHLSNSFSRLKFLRLPFHIYAENPIARMCPGVLELHLEIENDYGGEWTLQTLITEFAPLQSARTFGLHGHTKLTWGMGGVLDSVVNAFPNIKSLTIFEEEWVRFPDQTWKALSP